MMAAGFFVGAAAYLRFLAGVPPRALGSLLPPRGAAEALWLLAAALAEPRLLRAARGLGSLASARAARAARAGR